MPGRTRSRTHSLTVSRIIRSSSVSMALMSRKSSGSGTDRRFSTSDGTRWARAPVRLASVVDMGHPLYTGSHPPGKLRGVASASYLPFWGCCHIGGEKPRKPRFGREDAELSYGTYLRI